MSASLSFFIVRQNRSSDSVRRTLLAEKEPMSAPPRSFSVNDAAVLFPWFGTSFSFIAIFSIPFSSFVIKMKNRCRTLCGCRSLFSLDASSSSPDLPVDAQRAEALAARGVLGVGVGEEMSNDGQRDDIANVLRLL